MPLPAIGAALMKAGGGIAGKSAARSAAGSILKTGGSDALLAVTNIMSKNVKKIFDKVKKALQLLEKASPALKQQLIVFRKSILLFLRPIGDIMAKFVRPMAIWALKVAMKWYQLFGGGASKGGDPADALEQAIKQLDIAKEEGDPEQIRRAEEAVIKAEQNVAKKTDSTRVGPGSILDTLKSFGDKLWKDFIPDVLVSVVKELGTTFSLLWETLKSLWDIVGPLVEVIGAAGLTAALFALEGVLVIVNTALLGVKTILEFVKVGFQWLDYWLESLWGWLKDNIPNAFETVKEWFTNTIPTAISNMIAKAKEIFAKVVEWIKNLNPFRKKKGDDDGGRAVGGLVETTGDYKLHAGERILPAGQARKESRSINITNHFNIPSTINTDFDIRELAMRLADYSERELRRRVSYL